MFLVGNILSLNIDLRIYSYRRSDFAPDSFRRFKQLVITVNQPFRLGVPFGFGGVRVTKPSYAGQIQKQTPALSDPSK